MNTNYLPVIKTRISELKALRHLDDNIKKGMLPLIELTMSRRSKNLPEGSCDKSIDNILENWGRHKFIIDITGDDSLRNSELEELYDSKDGYIKWRAYLKSLSNKGLKFVPTILINLDGQYDEIVNQATNLVAEYGRAYLRIPVVDILEAELETILKDIPKETLGLVDVALDCGFIGQNKTDRFSKSVKPLATILKKEGVNTIRVISSSFPKLVISTGYGKDPNTGQFDLSEIKLFDKLKSEIADITWLYGDYGCVHPLSYHSKGGVWVPRIDIPLDTAIFYHRYRREEGGYKKAATTAIKDPLFDNELECWGMNQIKIAANNTPPGMSPSFWISVRANIHITRQATRLLLSK